MMKLLRKILIGLMFLSILTALGMTQKSIRDRRIQLIAGDRIFLLPKKEVLKVMAMGYQHTLADLLWIRAVQFFGGNYTTLIRPGFEYRGEGIRNLIYTIQYLDPDFWRLYQFGGFVFVEGMKDYEEAIRILEMGADHYPDDHELLFDAAFNAFFYLEDYEKARDLALRAAQKPDAPDHVKRFAGQMEKKMGRYDVAEQYFMRLVEESNNEMQQRIALQNLYRVRRERDIQQLETLADEYEKKHGKPIEHLTDLVRAGLIGRLPLDPEPEPLSPYHYVPERDEVVSLKMALAKREELRSALQRALNQAYQSTGQVPGSIEKLLPKVEMFERARDPLGGEFAIDPITRQIMVIPGQTDPQLPQTPVEQG
jgi:tetratricopeptide (TPR) repeat protein